jgi:ATP-dependent 26S proteasome regulatory subunit
MTKEELEKEAEEFTNSKKSFWRQGRTCIDSVKQAYLAGAEPREKQIEIDAIHIRVLQKQKGELTDKVRELEAQIEKMKKYGKLLQDICDVMGNDPYMVWRGLEQRVLILWDKSEEEKGLKMADDILERLLKLSAIDWAEIEKWEIKEND